MSQENKGLLLVDLCARLPYGVKVAISHFDEDGNLKRVSEPKIVDGYYDEKFTGPKCYGFGIYEVKPYLRPMPSMTDEEKEEYKALCLEETFTFATWQKVRWYDTWKSIDWLNKNMFDYRGLIEKGLAIEAPREMYS